MTINQASNPSFGRVYQAASSNVAREALSKYVDVVKKQKEALQIIDKNDYDVFLFMKNQLSSADRESKKSLVVEIRKKLMPPFIDSSTDFLVLKDGQTCVKNFVEGTDVVKGIKEFFNMVKDSLS
ncbi:hypothetical protein IJE86_03010 [bacterium]|nr:hypothetical protein [bacterium]